MRRIIFVFLMILLCFNITAYAESTALDITYSQTNSQYLVSISIKGNTGFCAGSFEIEYDHNSFSISNVTQGEIIKNAISVVNDKYKENSVKVSFMSLTPIAENGEIINFNLSPLSEDAYTTIKIKNLLLADEKENTIECSISDLEIGKKPEQSEKVEDTTDESDLSDISTNTGSGSSISSAKKKNNEAEQTIEQTIEQRKSDIICLQIDNSNAVAYGKKVAIDENNSLVVPYISHDRTLVPLRFVAETLGADVIWESGWDGCIIKKGNKEIKITFGSAEFTVNGKTIVYDAPIEVVEERTMVPVRFVSEEFNCDVYWNKENRAVIISPLTNPWKETRTTEKNALSEILQLIKK